MSVFSSLRRSFRLLRFRLQSGAGPRVLRDRKSLRLLRGLSLLAAAGALCMLFVRLDAGPADKSAGGRAPERLVFDSMADISAEDHIAILEDMVRADAAQNAAPSGGTSDITGGGGPRSFAGYARPHPGESSESGDAGTSGAGTGESSGHLVPDSPAYQEGERAPLADVAAQADAALLQALARLGLNTTDVADAQVVQSEVRLDGEGRAYPFLRLAIAQGRPLRGTGSDMAKFRAYVAESLKIWAPRARLRAEGGNLFFITVDNLVTHSLRYGPPPPGTGFPMPRPRMTLDRTDGADGGPPRLTIVIDDIGENLPAVRSLLALPYKVTLSVWPRSTHAAYAATLAHEKGRQVFLHQPLEARGVSRGQTRPETLYVVMPRADIVRGLRDSLGQVPYVEGVNNHMGSRFTADPVASRILCEELGRLRPGILVLDSLTHEASVFYDEARRQGLPAFRRALFLDDENAPHDKSAVLKNLDEGLALARRHGQAVVIGHPHPATLAALAAWRGYLATDVVIEPLAPRQANSNGGPAAPSPEIP